MNKVLKLFHIIMASPAFCKPFSGRPVGALFLPVFFHKRNPRDTGSFCAFSPSPVRLFRNFSPYFLWKPANSLPENRRKSRRFSQKSRKTLLSVKNRQTDRKNAKNPRTFVPGLSAYDFERSSCMKRKQLAVFNRFSLL